MRPVCGRRRSAQLSVACGLVLAAASFSAGCGDNPTSASGDTAPSAGVADDEDVQKGTDAGVTAGGEDTEVTDAGADPGDVASVHDSAQEADVDTSVADTAVADTAVADTSADTTNVDSTVDGDSGGPSDGDSDADSTEEPCPPGTYGLGGTDCVACTPGAVSEAGATACEPCVAGTYAVDNGCVACPEDFVSEQGASTCDLAPVASSLDARDYGYLFWPGNHWYSWGTFTNVQHVQTGTYGLALDVSGADLVHLGLLDAAEGPGQALHTPNSAITGLPAAAVTYSVVAGGQTHTATGFFGSDGSPTNPSQIVDMGRFMQRVQVPSVGYSGTTELTGSVQLAAMPRHFVLTHAVASAAGAGPVVVRIDIAGAAVSSYPETVWLDGARAVSIRDAAGDGWSFILPTSVGADPTITRDAQGALSLQVTFDSPASDEPLSLAVIAVPSNAGPDAQLDTWLHPTDSVTVESAQLHLDGSGGSETTPATWDPERGLYVIGLKDLSEVGAPGNQSWSDPTVHNWYNRHRVVVHNNTAAPVSVPLAFEGGNNAAFYIVGGSPLLRDLNGEPTGAPLQISKNWHEQPFWYHLYGALVVPPGSHEVEHTFAHSKWGEAYAAAHAQLSLVGWGQNQQWDESSLGAFGETITYDPDQTLSRAMVDDVRPFLVEADKKWGWTGNVGGANFLVYASTEGFVSPPDHQLGRMRTHYEYTGPNLTKVTYAGATSDGRIAATITTQLGRTDDVVRAWYHLRYESLDDVAYDRLALFQMAADRYSDNGFERHAYGNEDGVLFDEDVTDHQSTGYAADSDRGIPLAGDAPWVMLYDSSHTEGNLPEHLANVAFVVRHYEATLDGETVTTPHINIVRTYNGGWSQMGFELGIPYDATAPFVPAGSVIEATVEYVVPPASKAAWYGASDYLTALPAESFQSTDMALKLAADGRLEVTTTAGALLRTYPVELAAAPGAIAAQFTLTGGLGYTPISIRGLVRPDGWLLERWDGDVWQALGQDVHGNDYWQAYDDAATGTFDLVFNVLNQGTQQYRLSR